VFQFCDFFVFFPAAPLLCVVVVGFSQIFKCDSQSVSESVAQAVWNISLNGQNKDPRQGDGYIMARLRPVPLFG